MQPLDNALGIPAFLSKLWKMVDDPTTDDLICWSKDGKTFIIRKEIEFWYTLLPVYYKHNNMSSFIRQLNMYGFHKVPNLDNSTVESDKNEYQFLHPYFQRDQVHLLKNIKRKGATTKVMPSEKPVHELEHGEPLGKVLADVKYLHGRQSQVDSLLNSLKQENTVLWRELSVLRTKHIKQQQIVNKLIQFLVTIVQPSTRMGGLSGSKRRYPLMINESPEKKQKTAPTDGPTIHELDSAEVPPSEFYTEESELQDHIQAETTAFNAGAEKVESPASTSFQAQTQSPSTTQVNEDEMEVHVQPEIFSEAPNTVSVDDLLSDPDLPEDAANIGPLEMNDDFENDEHILIDSEDSDKVFLNPGAQDTLLTNLINGSYNSSVLNGTCTTVPTKKDTSLSNDSSEDMTVATRDPNMAFQRLNSVIEEDAFYSSEDIDNHIGSTQNELDQLKDFLNGCNSIDSSYLLNLFNDMPPYGLTPNQSKEEGPVNDLLTGSELAPYDSAIVDFNELFDDSVDACDSIKPELILNLNSNESINTPEITNLKPTFPMEEKNDK